MHRRKETWRKRKRRKRITNRAEKLRETFSNSFLTGFDLLLDLLQRNFTSAGVLFSTVRVNKRSHRTPLTISRERRHI